jgi:rhamnose utilization protein RhaD (predicted bifunctional aldolase and dehydrogenase)
MPLIVKTMPSRKLVTGTVTAAFHHFPGESELNLPHEFLALSQQIGADPLLVQGPGGNTSIKVDNQMWIKASGTLLADALNHDIFVAVDPQKAILELDGASDGSCRSALIDLARQLRPSIETTFHAMFPQKFVFHFHSVATICHAITVEGREALSTKLDGLSWVSTPYRKPGIPLSLAIREAVGTKTIEVIVLDNHGVIVVADSIERISGLIDEVESRLQLPVQSNVGLCGSASFTGWTAVPEAAALITNTKVRDRAISGTYYPDHVVFLGPALPLMTADEFSKVNPAELPVPVVLVEGEGAYIKSNATPAHRAMLDCIHDVLIRIPPDWTLLPIGEEAETELLNWDAEKYRQMLAK